MTTEGAMSDNSMATIDPSGVVLVGAGALGRDALSVAYALGSEGAVRGFVDDREELWGTEVNGVPVLGGVAWFEEVAADSRALLTVGSPGARRALDTRLTSAGVHWVTWVHPTAVVTPTVRLEEGVLVMARATATVDILLARHAVVNPGCTLAHDVQVGAYAYLSPGVDLAGHVVLEEGAYLGTGAVVIPGCRVGANATVGAGAVVVRDVPGGATVAGVPAKPLGGR